MQQAAYRLLATTHSTGTREGLCEVVRARAGCESESRSVVSSPELQHCTKTATVPRACDISPLRRHHAKKICNYPNFGKRSHCGSVPRAWLA